MPSPAKVVSRVSIQALIDARRGERERLAKILHDDIAGGLTAAGLSLDLLAMDLSPEMAKRVREIQDVLEHGFDRVRELSMEFHPDPATRFRVIPALEALVRRCQSRFPGKLEASLPLIAGEAMTAGQAQACYAVAEAALDNVLQHSRARRAWLVLEFIAPRGFSLSIRDDGDGFAKSSSTAGTGMAIIEHQAGVAELVVSVESGIGTGTLVQLAPAGRFPKGKRAHRPGIENPPTA